MSTIIRANAGGRCAASTTTHPQVPPQASAEKTTCACVPTGRTRKASMFTPDPPTAMTKKPRLLLPSLMAAVHLTSLQADWEPVAPLPEPNGGFVAGCVDGKIVIAGGTNWKDDTKRWLDEVHLFDPSSNHWTTGPKLPHSLAYAACASDGTKLFFAGGADGTVGRKEVYSLDANLKLA